MYKSEEIRGVPPPPPVYEGVFFDCEMEGEGGGRLLQSRPAVF